MSRCWTIKELKETNTLDFIMAILLEREAKLTNPYSPMSKKLAEAKEEIRKIAEERRKNNA